MDELSQENYPKTPTNVKLSTQIKDMGNHGSDEESTQKIKNDNNAPTRKVNKYCWNHRERNNTSKERNRKREGHKEYYKHGNNNMVESMR